MFLLDAEVRHYLAGRCRMSSCGSRSSGSSSSRGGGSSGIAVVVRGVAGAGRSRLQWQYWLWQKQCWERQWLQ